MRAKQHQLLDVSAKPNFLFLRLLLGFESKTTSAYYTTVCTALLSEMWRCRSWLDFAHTHTHSPNPGMACDLQLPMPIKTRCLALVVSLERFVGSGGSSKGYFECFYRHFSPRSNSLSRLLHSVLELHIANIIR